MKKSVILCFCNVVLSLVLTLACIQAVPVQASPLQSKTITGVITSGTDGFPLIGVSVQVQENSTGSITDLDGRYSVQASEGQTLVFSYIGFKSQTIKIGTSSIINVVLIEDNEMLDEVVVVGYGVQKKKLVTGATVQVKGDKIAELNTTNPLQAMQGQTPGVNITSISGQPGESLKVSIRGLGTIGNAEPLYLIDGVRGDISNLNPADIESIDILKDAASAAIYGAQAANGVVLVTTKNGKEGKAVVSFDGYFGVQNVAKEVNLLNTEQYIMIMDESHRNSTGSGYNWSGYKSIYDANGNLYDVDWLDKMFEDNAQMQSYTLGITGGSTVSQYAISLGYMSQEGIVGGKDVSNFSRYNFRIKYSKAVTLDEFVAATQRTLADAEKFASDINAVDEPSREKLLKKIPYINEQYVRIVDNRLVVEKNLANMDIVNFKISRHIYATYVNLTDELQRNGYKVTVQTYSKVVEHLAANPTARTTFRELFDEYCRLKTMTEQFFVVESPAELCAVIEQRHPLVKQAYDELGTAKVQALKYHVGNIRRELTKQVRLPSEYKIVKMIDTVFPKQMFISKCNAKSELQRIYDDLGIQKTAKAADLAK